MERGKVKVMDILEAKGLTFKVHHKELIRKVDVSIVEGEFCAIIGPNGAGKTTLLNLLNGDLKAQLGEIKFSNQILDSIDLLTLSRKRAVLPQLSHIPFSIKVFDIVNLGREPYRYEISKQYNQAVVLDCLQKMGIEHLAEHYYATLSGGEQHRVQIARTLAQLYETVDSDLKGKVLFLDEPTNHLDIHHQYNLMVLLKKLQQKGLTIVAVMHDLSLTLQFAEQIILLQAGKKFGNYNPDELVNSDALSTVYHMTMNILWNDQFKRYLVIPTL